MASDGKVVISTDLDNGGLEKGVKAIKGTLGGLTNVVKSLGAAIGVAFSVGAIVNFATEAVSAANELSDALTGLQSILDGQGRSFSDAQTFLEEYTADGLIPMTNAITAYKNLAARGYSDAQIRQTMTALKDASAFGRQSSYSMGEAVQSATEGLKNENSVLVDNAGVTKNVAKMWEEYAESIGTTSDKLTQEQKILAEVNGILEETKFQTGDAAKVAGTLSGQLSQLSVNFNNLKVAVGNALKPIVQSFLPAINTAVAAMTQFANSIATVTSALFGSVSNTTADAVTEVADSYSDAASNAEDLADATTAAEKAAKRYLAGFDEITKLGADSSSAAGSSATDSTSAVTTTVTATTEVQDEISPKIQAVIDKITALLEPLKNIDFTPAVEAFGRLKKAVKPLTQKLFEGLEKIYLNVLVPLAEWTVEEALPAFLDFLCNSLTEITDLVEKLEDILSGNSTISDFLGGLTETQTVLLAIAAALGAIVIAAGGLAVLNSFTGFIASVKALNAVGLIGKLAEVFAIAASGAGTLSEAISLVFGPGSIIAGIAAVIGGVVLAATNFFSMLKNGFNWAKEALMVFGIAIAAVGAIILGAPALVAGVVAAVVAAIATAAIAIKENWAEIATGFKNIVNGITGFINGLIKGVVDGVNAVINAINKLSFTVPDWIPGIGGSSLGFNLKTITSYPQIPPLAKGAVLPANKPFLAMVGDQKHGTNVEAPLETIQEAVAIVMEDMIQSNIAGHEATVAVLKEILEAVLGIHIGDDVIGQAVARYSSKMAIIKGGSV